MPTILLLNGFRFFFYSNENNEPIHVHIEKGSAEAKIWLETFESEGPHTAGFNPELVPEVCFNCSIVFRNDLFLCLEKPS
jgi:hypothetical protein